MTTAANNPADAEAVRMIRPLLAVFTAAPDEFTEWEAGFIASMFRLTTAHTDGTPVYNGQRLVTLEQLYTRKVKA